MVLELEHVTDAEARAIGASSERLALALDALGAKRGDRFAGVVVFEVIAVKEHRAEAARRIDLFVSR